MGQYWIPVNLDKKEFIDPHKLGAGLKLWEQLAAHPGTAAALVVLCAAMPEPRGGGDLDLEENWHGPERDVEGKHGCEPGLMPESYPEIAKRIIGRWAGDRIALVGDYAKDTDLAEEFQASAIYDKCRAETERVVNDNPVDALYRVSPTALVNGEPNPERGKYVHSVEVKPPQFTDISEDVCKVLEHELGGRFKGKGWRDFVKLADLCCEEEA